MKPAVKIVKMDSKVKKVWLKALKSGKYKQGALALKNVAGGYCCLGVLCDLYSQKFNVKWTVTKTGRDEFMRESSFLPKKFGNGRKYQILVIIILVFKADWLK